MKHKEKAEELFIKFYSVLGYELVHGNFSVVLNQKLEAKQCALICVETEYNSLREQLFNLKACGLIPNENVYCHRLQELIDEEQQVKTEIERL